MAKLAHIDSFIVDLPTIRPHILAMATMHAQSMVLLRLTDSDGIEGIGEGTTIGGLSYGEESPEGIKLAIDTYITPLLQGVDLSRVGAVMARIGKHVAGNHIAKCAVETALLDMQGKRLGVPVSELIGGGRRREAFPVAWTLASGDTARDIEEAEAMLEARRHAIFKLKIGKRSVKADVAHVAAIKRALVTAPACGSMSIRAGARLRPIAAWPCFRMRASIWSSSPSPSSMWRRWRGSRPNTSFR
jgi:muconate cycloisomerase